MGEFILALQSILTAEALSLIFIGVILGTIAGALPGITPTIAVALMLPITFPMDPLNALVTLGAVYMAAEYGGSISAILINTPGSAGAIATALDGHALAQKGRAQDALLCAINGSSIGGMLGVICLLLFTPPLSRLSLRFGPPEMFWLAVAGLSVICSLTAKDIFKGLIAGGIGLWISTIGMDPIGGVPRFTFNSSEMQAGISLLPALLGFFSISQMLLLMSTHQEVIAKVNIQSGRFIQMIKYAFSRPVLVLRSSIIGVLVGILPGAGASIAAFISYGEAKRASKNPDSFGQGNPEGVIASETANNAMVGGSLVPLLTFGIPGSPSAAVIFGALAMHGLIPGPRLLVDSADVVYPFMLSFIPAVIGMFLVGSFGAKWFASVLKIRACYVIPTVFILTLIGSYSVRYNFFDLVVTAVCGVFGFFMHRFDIKMAPVILGIILGPMAEEGFRRSVSIGEAHGSVWMYFIGRPICVVLIVITLLMIILPLYREYRSHLLSPRGAR